MKKDIYFYIPLLRPEFVILFCPRRKWDEFVNRCCEKVVDEFPSEAVIASFFPKIDNKTIHEKPKGHQIYKHREQKQC